MLVFVRASRYDAGTGQFTQQDPIGIAGGANVYGFAGGDPVNFSDPFGLCTKATNKDGSATDCEKFARFVEDLAARTESDEQFIAALGVQIAGFADGTSEGAVARPPVGFGASGFRPELTDDRSPARHYSAYVVAAFEKGYSTAGAIATLREAPLICGGGCSMADVRLGWVGASHGANVRGGGASGPRGDRRAKLAALIRKDL